MKFVLMLALGLFLVTEAHAQAFPTQTITIVVPRPPGGGSDTLARILADKMSGVLGQTVIVENIAGGATGTVGATHVVQSEPDGYTLLVGYTGTHGVVATMSQIPYEPHVDLVAVALFAGSQQVLVVNPALPVTTVEELVALAAAEPGVLNYASAGNGSAPHLAGEMLKYMLGLDIEHIAYSGANPAILDTVAGNVQLMFPSIPAAAGFIESGHLRALAVTGAVRSAKFPDLPTMQEAAPGLDEFESLQWFGLFAPAGTPQDALDTLTNAVEVALQDPGLIELFGQQGADPIFMEPVAFDEYIKADTARWQQVVTAANIVFE